MQPTVPVITIASWLQQAGVLLSAKSITSPRLDAEIILAHTLHKSRSFLHAHGDEPLEPHHNEIANARLHLRLDHTPIAYITGHKEFYGRLFNVTPATLIPRPESEMMIELLKQRASSSHTRLIDVGTGSGCLGITAKLELPHLRVTLSDISRRALAVAKENATRLRADVLMNEGDLLKSYRSPSDIILANLPYVGHDWQCSPETQHEPSLALFAKDDGMELIHRLLHQSVSHLTPGGLLFLEADPRQHKAIVDAATHHGFALHNLQDFIIVLQQPKNP